VAPYEEDENCFRASDSRAGKSIALCSLLTLTGVSLKANRDEWIKEIGFFKDNCHEELVKVDADESIANIKKGEL